MGQYHDPDTITTVGRKLNEVYPHKFETLAAQLKPGEKLFGVYQRIGMFKIAPYIPVPEFLAFELAAFDGARVLLLVLCIDKAVLPSGDLRLGCERVPHESLCRCTLS